MIAVEALGPRAQVSRRHSRSSLGWLLCRRQRDQRNADDDKNRRSDQFCASDHVKQRLQGHYSGVREAPPRREGHEAAVR